NSYQSYSIVFLDEWYTCVDWNSIIKYLNDIPEKVEIKGKLFVPFLAKYIFITSCKPVEEAFNFGLESDFCGMLWDLKYDKYEYTTEKLKKIVQERNKDEPEEVIIKDNQIYWHQIFP
ncbi:13994_t:CDS:2, partial [Dentiscutata heterogama]